MVLGHAVFEAVRATTGRADVYRVADLVEDGFAGFFVALFIVVEKSGTAGEGCRGGVVKGCAFARPFAFFGAFVGSFGAMVEAECSFA